MRALRAPVPPVDRHWCLACRECPSCDGGRAVSDAWVPYIDWRTGVCIQLCADCNGAAVLCPALAVTA